MAKTQDVPPHRIKAARIFITEPQSITKLTSTVAQKYFLQSTQLSLTGRKIETGAGSLLIQTWQMFTQTR